MERKLENQRLAEKMPAAGASAEATWSFLWTDRQGQTAAVGDSGATGLRQTAKQSSGLVTGAYSQQGRKPGNPEYLNQDRYLEMRFGGGKLLLGVFDGHGPAGHVMSQRTKEVFASMAPSIAEAADARSAFLQAFAQCAFEIERQEGSYENGATVTLVLIDPSSRTASIAHVGDSAAMIVRPGGVIAFQTKDHKADAEGERQRLEDHGSYIHEGRLCLTNRTGPSLALSRSIGDLAYRQRGLSAEPDIACGLPFEPGSVMILASDGVWDMMAKDEVASKALQAPPQEAVESLIAVSHFRWLAQRHMDDITAMIVKYAAAPFHLQASQPNSLWLHSPGFTAERPQTAVQASGESAMLKRKLVESASEKAALSLGLAKRQARTARLTAVQVKMRNGAAESEAAAGVRAADLQVAAASGVSEAVAAVAAGTHA